MNLNNGFINSTIICNGKKEVDLDALNFLASGEDTHLCQCVYKNENKHHLFIYDTNNAIPLVQLQMGLSFENVVDILSSTVDMIHTLNENNLCLNNVKNAKEYIFKTDDGYKFIYIPITYKASISIKDYMIKLVTVIHYKDVRLTQFTKELRKKKDNEQVLAFIETFVSSYNSHYDYSEDATSLLSDENATSLLSEDCDTSLLNVATNNSGGNTFSSSDDCETTVLHQTKQKNLINEKIELESEKLTEYFHDESGEYETTVLTSQPVFPNQPTSKEIQNEYYLYLIRNLNGEKINIDVTPFTIGKDTTNMDFVLNNDSVSRHHATIIYETGDYYIMDNNSTNGTTIEGIKLQPGEKGEIGNGYIISLGNESFQAHIERR